MTVTPFGVVFLPLCLVWCLRPERLLQLVLVGAAFGSAAVVTVGDYGVSPSLVPALLFAAFVLLQLLLGVTYRGRREAWRVVVSFVLVTLWALIGSWLLPRLFAGGVEVWPQKPSLPLGTQALAPDPGNLTQDLYLATACLTLWLGAEFCAQSRLDTDRVVRAYLLGGYLAVGVTLWQFADRFAGLGFPAGLLLSNPGWSQLTDQQIGGVTRIGGPFSEPAALAGYMSGIVGATGWMILKGHRGAAIRVLLPLALACMALSTSTTGYAVLALLAVALPVLAALRGSTRLFRRVVLIGAGLVTLAGIAAAAAVALAPGVSEAAADVALATFGKGGSASFDLRARIDADSLDLLVATWGLGVGWGSNRAASLLPGTLASLGVAGTLGLAWFAARVVGLARRARPLVRDGADARALDAAAGALVATVLAALLSGPTLTDVGFYLLLALLIGTAARVASEAGEAGVGAAW